MHELSVTEELLGIVLDQADKAKAKRVGKINLVIGDLAGFSGDSIEFFFSFLSKGTPAEKASLSVTHLPAKALCHPCGKEFNPGGLDWNCPFCGGPLGEVLSGREFYIESIEVE